MIGQVVGGQETRQLNGAFQPPLYPGGNGLRKGQHAYDENGVIDGDPGPIYWDGDKWVKYANGSGAKWGDNTAAANLTKVKNVDVWTSGYDQYVKDDVKYFRVTNRPDGVAVSDADLGPMYLKTVEGYYLQRAVQGRWLNAEIFGVVADGNPTTGAGTDNTSRFQALVNMCKIFGKDAFVKNISSLTGGYRITSTITIPEGVNWENYGTIIYDTAATDSTPAFILGVETANTSGYHCFFRVKKPTSKFSDWSVPDGNSAAVRAVNVMRSEIEIDLAQGFTSGLICEGRVNTGAGDLGFSYNKVNLFRIWNNRQGIWLRTVRGGGTGVPFVNQNAFYGGTFSSPSGGSNQANKSRYGVRVTQSADLTGSHNNNSFYDQSFELNGTAAGSGDALPVLLEGNVIFHRFYNPRSEGNKGAFFGRITGSANPLAGNRAYVGYSLEQLAFDDQSTQGTGNYCRNEAWLFDQFMDNVIFETDISKRLKGYGATTGNMIPGLMFLNPAISAIPSISSNNIIIGPNGGILAVQNTNTTVGVWLNTTKVKSFFVSKNSTTIGRIRIVCYGANNAVLGDNTNRPFKASELMNFVAIGVIPATYATQSDDKDNVTFEVGSTVEKVFIGLANGSSSLASTYLGFKSFEIKALAHGCDYELSYPAPTQAVSIAEPASGYYKQGEISINLINTAGVFGWQATTAGYASKTAWSANTAYTVGAVVYSGNNVYVSTLAGTSATLAPNHTSGTVNDGTTAWLYLASRAAFLPLSTTGTTVVETAITSDQLKSTTYMNTQYPAALPGAIYVFTNITDASANAAVSVKTGSIWITKIDYEKTT